VQRQVGGQFQPVSLVVVHLGEVGFALPDDDVASRTGAVAAASMFQIDAEVQRHIQQRSRLPVIVIGQPAGFEFDRYVGGEKRDLRHLSDYKLSALIC